MILCWCVYKISCLALPLHALYISPTLLPLFRALCTSTPSQRGARLAPISTDTRRYPIASITTLVKKSPLIALRCSRKPNGRLILGQPSSPSLPHLFYCFIPISYLFLYGLRLAQRHRYLFLLFGGKCVYASLVTSYPATVVCATRSRFLGRG